MSTTTLDRVNEEATETADQTLTGKIGESEPVQLSRCRVSDQNGPVAALPGHISIRLMLRKPPALRTSTRTSLLTCSPRKLRWARIKA